MKQAVCIGFYREGFGLKGWLFQDLRNFTLCFEYGVFWKMFIDAWRKAEELMRLERRCAAYNVGCETFEEAEKLWRLLFQLIIVKSSPPSRLPSEKIVLNYGF